MPDDALVFKLINDENKWNERLIYNHFDKMDTDNKVNIPLPRRAMRDKLLRHYEKRQHTVKSGYWVALILKFLVKSLKAIKNQWKIIWTLALT